MCSVWVTLIGAAEKKNYSNEYRALWLLLPVCGAAEQIPSFLTFSELPCLSATADTPLTDSISANSPFSLSLPLRV